MPFGLFVLFCGELAHLDAGDELRVAHGSAYGAAIGMGGGNDPKLRRHARNLLRLAYPEVDDDG